MQGLYKMRKAKSLTQAALAEELGVSQNTICSWEKGTRSPNAKKLKRLADFFGCSIQDLF